MVEKPKRVETPAEAGVNLEGTNKNVPSTPKENLERDTLKNQEREQVSILQPEPEKTDDKSKEFQSALAQKEHYREKYEKAQNELNEFKKSSPKIDLPNSSNPMDIVRLAKSLGGYNEDEIEFITKNAETKDIEGIISATKDEWVQSAITSRRQKVEKEKGIPEPGSTSAYGNKTFADVKKMSAEEHKAYVESYEKKEGSGY